MMSSSHKKTGSFVVLLGFIGLAVAPVMGQQAGSTIRGEQAYPTGDRGTSMLLIQHLAPAEMRINEAFTYEIHVRNLTGANLKDFVITEQLPDAFQVKSIDPKPESTTAGKAVWNVSSLGPNAVLVARVNGVPTRLGELNWCTTVAFDTQICSGMRIVEPALKLTKSAPAEVIQCDMIPIKLVVTNTGSGNANDVKVADKLPEGWLTSNAKASIDFSAGTLKPGESREFSFQAKSSGTGTFVNEATASESGGLTASARSETVVRKPVLNLTKTAPAMRYIGRPAEHTITVSNTGDAPARDTMLVDTMSGVGEFVKASDNGQFANGKITWNLGTLAPGASKTVNATFVGRSAGTIKDDAVATAYCTDARASASTEVRGVPAVLLELIDTADPIEVGASETYMITVTNQGTADDNNIQIKCILPDEQEYVSAEGPTKVKTEGKNVIFEPLPSLSPKAKAVYRVVVKGTRSEDVRFSVQLTSDMLTSPVRETESTHIYE